MQVWSKPIYSFKSCADKPFSNNLSPPVTLKTGSRSPKTNQHLSPSQWYICVSLAKICPFNNEIECGQEATPTPPQLLPTPGSALKTICPSQKKKDAMPTSNFLPIRLLTWSRLLIQIHIMTNSANPVQLASCLQRQGISGFSRTRIKVPLIEKQEKSLARYIYWHNLERQAWVNNVYSDQHFTDVSTYQHFTDVSYQHVVRWTFKF